MVAGTVYQYVGFFFFISTLLIKGKTKIQLRNRQAHLVGFE